MSFSVLFVRTDLKRPVNNNFSRKLLRLEPMLWCLSIIYSIEQGTGTGNTAVLLNRHSMCLLCTFCRFKCSLLHSRLYETTERALTQADMHILPTIAWTSQSARITEVVAFSQMRFSLQGNRWGSFPLGLNSTVRDEALQNSSALSRRINTPSPASQPCWDPYSLSTAAPPQIETAGIFSATTALLCISGVCFGSGWN